MFRFFIWYFSMLYIVCLHHCMYVCYMFIKNINQSIIIIVVNCLQTIRSSKVSKVYKQSIIVRKHASLLRELMWRMGLVSHSVTCHPAEVTFPPLLQPIKDRTQFDDPREMQGWVDLVLRSETIFPSPPCTLPSSRQHLSFVCWG